VETFDATALRRESGAVVLTEFMHLGQACGVGSVHDSTALRAHFNVECVAHDLLVV
jgi:hypothetical protein